MKPNYKKNKSGTGHKEPEGFRNNTGVVPGIPVLNTFSGMTNPEQEWNYIHFTQRMVEYVEVTYGDIADIFRKSAYPDYKMPEYNLEDFTERADPLGIKREELREQIKIRAKRIATLEENKPKIYALIKSQISRECLSAISMVAEFRDIEVTRDPLKLWKAVSTMNLVDMRNADIDSAKAKAQQAFNQCRMLFYESLSDFKTRFELRLRIYQSLWSAESGDGEEVQELKIPGSLVAQYFIDKLDPERYATIQENYRNRVYAKCHSLQEVYQFISMLSVPKKSTKPVFHQRSEEVSSNESNTKSNQSTKASKTKDQSGKTKSKKGPSKEHPCAICGSSTHWARDCPDKESEQTKEQTGQAAGAQPQKKKNFLIIPLDVIDEEDEQETLAMSEADDSKPIPDQGLSPIQVSNSILVASSELTAEDIVLDTGGSESIFCNKHLSTGGTFRTTDGVSIGGAVSGGGSIVSYEKMNTTFGDVYYSKKCAANILAYSQIKDRAHACYQNKDEDCFRVQMEPGGEIHIFTRKLGIYVKTDTQREERDNNVFIVTVEQKKSKYTTDDIR